MNISAKVVEQLVSFKQVWPGIELNMLVALVQGSLVIQPTLGNMIRVIEWLGIQGKYRIARENSGRAQVYFDDHYPPELVDIASQVLNTYFALYPHPIVLNNPRAPKKGKGVPNG